jgi:amino acid adenylation domain-containing protein/non-ribosomal peptide synthase protein (TIGR01720 family)
MSSNLTEHAMTPPVDSADNIVLRLSQLAQTRPHDNALITVDANGEQHYSYAQLQACVHALARRLQQRHAPGERVLLLLDNDVHYVVGFFACLSVGLIAVPLHRPESIRGQHLQRLTGIAEDAGACCWLVTQAMQAALQADNTPLAGQAVLLAVDAIQEESDPGAALSHTIAADDVAFLQYTSGSTSQPKGVMVTHANLMANEAAIQERLGVRSDDTFVSWLPLYHDMGLIGGLLQPFYRGIPVVLMSPAFFLERPIRWLEALSRHRGTISGGPDFSYRLCVDRIRAGRAAGLDLSHWRVAFSGAEPIRHDTLSEFIDNFRDIGFSADAVYPCYGLAESTLLVTGGQRDAGMRVAAFDADGLRRGTAMTATTDDANSMAIKLVGCGISPTAHQVRIADPQTGAALPAGQVGEIWAGGPSIAAGYWRREQDSATTFVQRDGQRWLRTGDLGFVDDGALFITGRSKDMIIVRGQNLYPQDIERAIESEVELTRKGRVAAFAVPAEHAPGGVEGIGIALEISRSVQKMVPPQVLIDSLQEAIVQACSEPASVIVLLNPGALPKTSSGKLQRSACRSGWLEASLDAYAVWAFGSLSASTPVIATAPAAATAGADEIETTLLAIWQRVMQVTAVDRDAHFFRHGGSSLKAVQLAAAIGEQWQITLPVRSLFEQPQLLQIAQLIRELRNSAATPVLTSATASDIPQLSAAQRQALLPLSPAQHSLWTTWQLDPDNPAYNMPGVLHLSGSLNVGALEQALDDLVARHAILRTVYLQQPDGEPRQQILAAVTGVLSKATASKHDDAQAQQLLQEFAQEPFMLERDIPLRALLIPCEEQRHLLGLSLHHIAGDGWSLPILLNDLTALYAARCTGTPASLPALQLQFADYAVWQQQRLDAAEQQRQLDYWRARLGDEHAPLSLPYGRRQALMSEPAGAAAGMPEARYSFSLPAGVASAFRQLCAEQGVSLYMGMLGLLNLLLYRTTGSADVRIGSPMADRSRAQTHDMIGYLINLHVLRTQVDSHLGFDALLQQIRATVLAAQQHQDVSFDMVVKALQPERSAHVHPLCQIKCTERAALPPQWHSAGLSIALEELTGAQAHFDLSLDFSASANGIDCLFVYASTRFDADSVQLLATALTALAQQTVRQPQLPLAQLQVPGPSSQLHGPAQAFTYNDVISCWQQQVRQHPQRLAVADEQHALNAAALQEQVEHLAAQLQQHGIGSESRVGVASGRQVEFVVGVLASLRVGACYVPLDPQLPDERLAYQMADSGISLLLATAEAERLQHLTGAPPTILPLQLASAPLRSDCSAFRAPHPQQAAYLIYTSGSTGRPKGVVLTHGGLANYVQGVLTRLDLPDTVRSMGMVSTVAADLGHTSFFGALCSGRSLHLLSAQAAFDPARFAEVMQAQAIDVLKIVPSHLQALLQSPQAAQVLPRHTLIVGGETTSASLLQQIHTLRPDCRVLNHYGPTETTVGVLTHALPLPASIAQTSLPLGLPLPNLRMLVLDTDLNPVPAGGEGELYMGGVALARGYQGRAAATAERFIADPSGNGERLYRSGDKVRLDRQGNLVFLGRCDDQLKIRGYRVEPQEIASVLRAQDGVAAAEVLATPGVDGRLQLSAYVVAATPQGLDAALLRTQLAALLPDYMVPTHILLLEQLPLNANGKIDRKALPLPAAQSSTEVVPLAADALPQSRAEIAVAQIWQEVLGVVQVSRNDNFFTLGGDSILTLKIVARLRKAGWRITPRQLMQSTDLAALATQAVELAAPVAAVAAVPVMSDSAPLPLTPIQQWFFSHHAEAPSHWNQSVLLQGPATTPVATLQAAVATLTQQHEALRLRFKKDQNGVWTQYVSAAPIDCFEHIALPPKADVEAAIGRAQRSLDLQQGPLWRVLWLTNAKSSAPTATLALIAHHLVVDGVSWRILLEDLQTLLQGGQLVAPGVPFSQWAQALPSAAAQLPEAERDYWQRIAALAPEELPCTPAKAVGKRADNTIANAAREQIVFDRDSTAQLLGDAHAAYRTRINDLLLSAAALTLCEWAQRDHILIEVEAHGREELHGTAAEALDLSRTVGWFTALYPVQLSIGSSAPAALIKSVKEQLRQVPRNGIGYGLWRYLTQDAAAAADSAQAEVTFNYLGRFDELAADAQWRMLPRDNALAEQERAPASMRRALLEFNAMVVDGQLHLQCVYCSALHQPDTMRALLQHYAHTLHGLLAHCAGVVGAATPSDFPLTTLNQQQLDEVLDSLPAAKLTDLYPLSPMQSGMLFHALLAPQSGAYLNQLRVNLQRLDAARFQDAWRQVVSRHEILRSGFVAHADPALQWVSRDSPLALTEYDWRGRSDLDSALEALAATDHARGVDLLHPPLMRLTLVRVSELQHHLIWTRHHLLLDGWSTQQLIGEVLRLYHGAVLPAPTLRYRDYIDWLQQQDRAAAEAFWRQQLLPLATLDGLPKLVNGLPPVRHGGSGQQVSTITLDVLATAQLQAFAKDCKSTVNTLVQAAWSLVLQRYCRQATVVFGATVAGRSSELAGADELLGLFINTVPVVVQLQPAMTVLGLLEHLQATNLAVREFDSTPLYDIQAWAGQGGQALFDSILVFENYPLDLALQDEQASGLQVEVVSNREETHYPLTVVATLTDCLQLEWRYDTAVIETQAANAIVQQMLAVLQQLSVDAGQRLGNLMPLPEHEQARMAALSVNTESHDHGSNVLALIEAQAAGASDLPALRVPHAGQALSYGELNRQANQMAHWLMAQGIGADSRVGVCMERSQEMVLALLAIMKTGAAYVPMDPDHPPQRLQYFIEDSRTSLLLTHAPVLPHLQALTTADCRIVDVATLAADLQQQPQHNTGVQLHPEQLAYVIYTSGSTGQPKGVANRVRALHNRLAWMQQAYQLGRHDRVLQKTPFGFDVSVWEFFWPLMTGAELVLAAPGEHRDPARLAALIDQCAITTLHFVPSMLQAFVSDVADVNAARCPSLQRVICSGEALPMELQQQAQRQLPQAQLINLYGPTEAAIDVTHWTCVVDDTGSSVPIGQPISATQTYVLDEALQLVPQGVAGELYLGGINLARGYLGKPGLTAERFVANPFSTDGERLYRTGDLVRWREDGQLMYLGRLDHQVKIRGLRIELGEIEAALLAQSSVREAVVVADSGMLVGYVSAQAGATVDEAVIRQALAQHLPEYMVPSVLMVLPTLPLSTNGKIDRKLLPKVERVSEQAYAAPEGELEQQLAAIWQTVLGVERVGRHDNFFALGGHSLLATSVLAHWRALRRPQEMNLRMLFAAPVLQALAAELERQPQQALALQAQPQAVPRQERMPLSPMQQRLWLVNRMQGAGEAAAYNMTAALQLDGKLSEPVLRRTLQALLARHEILRTGYYEDDDGEAYAAISSVTQDDAGVLSVIDLRAGTETQQQAVLEQEMQRQSALPFDLTKPPLLRAVLLQLAADAQGHPRHVLLLALHHIVADGWSVGVLIREFSALYRVFTADLQLDLEAALPAQPLQYLDYAVWQQQQARQISLQADEQFWRQTLTGAPDQPALPVDMARPLPWSSAGGRLSLQIPAGLSTQLAALAQAQDVTLFMLLLSSFQLLIHRLSGQDDVLIGTDVAGREHQALEPLVGFFVNVLPLRSRSKPQLSFAGLLQETREAVLDAFAHQALPFERIAEVAGSKRDRRWNLLLQLLFVMQNTPAGQFDLPDLQVQRLPSRQAHAKFDLALFVTPEQGVLQVELVYATALFKPATIAHIAAAWSHLLEQIVAQPDLPSSRFVIPSLKEALTMSSTAPVAATPVATPTSMPTSAAMPGKLDKLSKLNKLNKLNGAPAAAQPPVRMVPLRPDADFPLLIEATSTDLDTTVWARENKPLIAELLARHGGVLFRRFGLKTPQEFERFAEAIEPELYGSYGDLPKKEGGKKTYRSTPYPEKQMILYHNESAHIERWPRKQWFFCELPSPVGGATPIVDCREMLRRLPAQLRREFEQKQLLYVRTFTPRLDVSWQSFYQTDDRAVVEARLQAAGSGYRWLDDDTLQTSTRCPAVIVHPLTGAEVFFNQVQLHHPYCLDPEVRRDLLAMVGPERLPRNVLFGDGTPISDATMELIGNLYEECAVRFDWQQGDVVMLDNMLAAHARDPFEGPRKIVVAMGAMVERAEVSVPSSDAAAITQTGAAS